MSAQVEVIVPTTCEPARWRSLRRALVSLFRQTINVEVIVVVNGNRFRDADLAVLRSITGIRLIRQREASLPLALRTGRAAVKAPYFAFLDDDDEYLPDALEVRLRALTTDPSLDFVSSQGYRHVAGVDRAMVRCPNAVIADPLRALSSENWLASCSGLFRTARVPVDYFDGKTRYLEWTLLAYKLAAKLRMSFVDTPTYRVHESPGSLSKSDDYRIAEVSVLNAILQLPLPADVRRQVRKKLGKSNHGLADFYRVRGDWSSAWRYHLVSLRYPAGWRFLPFTRKLCGIS